MGLVTMFLITSLVVASGVYCLLHWLGLKSYSHHQVKNSFSSRSTTDLVDKPKHISTTTSPIPISVNYHFTRVCNYSCGFCFHTSKTSSRLSLADSKHGLSLLRDAGMRKLNFAGGEPFLYPKLLGNMVLYARKELGIESVSIVTNGSLVTKNWLEKYGREGVDILAVSCDSFDEDTNVKIGRTSGVKGGKEDGGKGHVEKMIEIAEWCRRFNIKFKLNTVVNRYNYLEDMNPHIERIKPFRWKCFQVLIVAGENDGPSEKALASTATTPLPTPSQKTLRSAHHFTITPDEFKDFCSRHSHQPSFVPEPNDLMMSSYLILDESMRFLDKSCERASPSILEVGVTEALKDAGWDEVGFLKRGGVYDWTKGSPGPEGQGAGCGVNKEDARRLEW